MASPGYLKWTVYSKFEHLTAEHKSSESSLELLLFLLSNVKRILSKTRLMIYNHDFVLIAKLGKLKPFITEIS